MKNQFVKYKIALKLKELGFNEPCLMYYHISIENKLHSNVSTSTLHGAMISDEDYMKDKQIKAPLWQQVIEWLDNKDIHIIIYFPQSISGCVGIISTIENSMLLVGEIGTIWKNRIDFYEAAILKAIEIINH